MKDSATMAARSVNRMISNDGSHATSQLDQLVVVLLAEVHLAEVLPHQLLVVLGHALYSLHGLAIRTNNEPISRRNGFI